MTYMKQHVLAVCSGQERDYSGHGAVGLLTDKNSELFCMIRESLKNYIYNEVIPGYAAFDKAHREDHALNQFTQKNHNRCPPALRISILNQPGKQ